MLSVDAPRVVSAFALVKVLMVTFPVMAAKCLFNTSLPIPRIVQQFHALDRNRRAA